MIVPTLGASWALLAFGGAVAWVLHPLLHRWGLRGGLESFALGVVVGPVLGWLVPEAHGHLWIVTTVVATLLAFSVGVHTDLRWFRDLDGTGARGAVAVAVAVLTSVIVLALTLGATLEARPHPLRLIALAAFVAAPLIVMQEGRLTPSSRELPGTASRALQRLVLTATAVGLIVAFVASLFVRHDVTTAVPSAFYVTLGASVGLIVLAAWGILGLLTLLPVAQALWGAALMVVLVAVLGDGLGVFAPFLGLCVGVLVSLVARPFVMWGRRADRWYGLLASPILLVAGASWVGDVGPRVVGVASVLLLVRYLAHRLVFRGLARTLGDGLHGLAWPTSALAFAIVLEGRAFGDAAALVDGRAALILVLATTLLTSRVAVQRSLRLADPAQGLA